jgi:hypothetical protein
MSKQIQLPFAGLKFKGDKVVNNPVKPSKKRKPYKRRIPSVPFVLQAFNGDRWQVIRRDGLVVTSKRQPDQRNLDFGKCLKDGGFVRQMKIQVFGRQQVDDKTFFSTPIRWKRIDAVSLR